MEKFKIELYEYQDGLCPIEKFIQELDEKMSAKLMGMLEILEEKGNLLREPYSKHLKKGIFEIRIKVGNNIIRVLYFFADNRKIILTNGFVKKT